MVFTNDEIRLKYGYWCKVPSLYKRCLVNVRNRIITTGVSPLSDKSPAAQLLCDNSSVNSVFKNKCPQVPIGV